MADIDDFATSLLEESKRFLEKVSDVADDAARHAYLHASLLLAFCSLEAHVNAICEEFADRPEFTIHEKGLLLEKDVKLESGAFIFGGLKMSRLEERILFLHRHFAGAPLDTSANWWSQLKAALAVRNKLTHPKSAQPISVQDAREALSATIAAIDNLYKIIYKKTLPAASRALQSRLSF
jgi:hypothetical protein